MTIRLGIIASTLAIGAIGNACASGAPVAPPGQQTYATSCAMCHGASLQGGAGPALKGSQVAAMPAAVLFARIKATMPLTKPGSLSDAQYHALVDFILAQNKAK